MNTIIFNYLEVLFLVDIFYIIFHFFWWTELLIFTITYLHWFFSLSSNSFFLLLIIKQNLFIFFLFIFSKKNKYFGIITFGFIFDHLLPVDVDETGEIRPDLLITISTIVLVIIFAGVFIHFYPLPYGYPGPISDMAKLQWLKSWRIV